MAVPVGKKSIYCLIKFIVSVRSKITETHLTGNMYSVHSVHSVHIVHLNM